MRLTIENHSEIPQNFNVHICKMYIDFFFVVSFYVVVVGAVVVLQINKTREQTMRTKFNKKL